MLRARRRELWRHSPILVSPIGNVQVVLELCDGIWEVEFKFRCLVDKNRRDVTRILQIQAGYDVVDGISDVQMSFYDKYVQMFNVSQSYSDS